MSKRLNIDENKSSSDVNASASAIAAADDNYSDINATAKPRLSKDILEKIQARIRPGLFHEPICRDIDDNMMPEVCKWIIEQGDEMNMLNLNRAKITSNGANMLLNTLQSSHSKITSLNMSECGGIDDKCMKSLGEFIKNSKCIEGLHLDSDHVSDAGIEILAPYLDGNTILNRLSFFENKDITDTSIPLLLKMVEYSHIVSLRIDKTSISKKEFFTIPLAHNSIKYGAHQLDLSSKHINDNNLIKICEFMKKYGVGNIKMIGLHQNQITSLGASVLFRTLRECTSVISALYFSFNQLDDKCMKDLGEFIQDNETLELLYINNNHITDKAVEILSEYLVGNTTLKEIHLSWNQGITNISAPYLIDIAKGSSVIEISITLTSISLAKEKEINEALSVPIDKREITIKSNTKSAAKIS